MSDDPIPAALRVASLFEELDIDYWLGGSLASSIHGEPRSTNDVGFVVALGLGDVARLVARLEPEYHVDEESVCEAVHRRASFQVVARSTYQRVDVFLKRDEPFADAQLRRRRRETIDPETGASLWVTSPEDIVLQKLVWFRKGDEVSDRQWRDVLGVLKANEELDRSYLRSWADELAVADLLQRALGEAGRTSNGES